MLLTIGVEARENVEQRAVWSCLLPSCMLSVIHAHIRKAQNCTKLSFKANFSWKTLPSAPGKFWLGALSQWGVSFRNACTRGHFIFGYSYLKTLFCYSQKSKDRRECCTGRCWEKAGGRRGEKGGWGSRGRDGRDRPFGFLISSAWFSLSVFFFFFFKRPPTNHYQHRPYICSLMLLFTITHTLQLKPSHSNHHEGVQEQRFLEGRSSRTGRHGLLYFSQHLCSHWKLQQRQPRPGGEGVADLWISHRHSGPELRPHQWSPPESRRHPWHACQLPDQRLQGSHVHSGSDAGFSPRQRHRLRDASFQHQRPRAQLCE